jgi:hypothetical protein
VTDRDPTREPGAEATDVPAGLASREHLLEAIHPDAAREHHELLRALLKAEINYRANAAEPQEYFENLYWCAFLLFCVGDPADVPALWQAKQINFDTASGLDVQTLFGAGVGPTLAWLHSHGHSGLADQLTDRASCEPDLAGWRADKERYFYS